MINVGSKQRKNRIGVMVYACGASRGAFSLLDSSHLNLEFTVGQLRGGSESVVTLLKQLCLF
jgi:hypothetical protein